MVVMGRSQRMSKLREQLAVSALVDVNKNQQLPVKELHATCQLLWAAATFRSLATK